MKVPFVDLHAQYLSIQESIDSAIKRVISNTSFIGGKEVDEFEKAFASYLSVKHCIGCANGTDSLEIILKAWNIGHGDEVLVPAISWISTSESVSSVGATPVFVDIDPNYYTIDPKKIEAKISSKTKAIIPVHLYGQACDMDELMSLADKYNLMVLEDCAQAHGAKWKGKLVGTIGHAGSFSFYPGKNLGAYGDAGAMVTNDEALAQELRKISQHGQQGKHNHVIEGRNSRLDGLQAAILSAKLPYLKLWTERRQQIAEWYKEFLKPDSIVLPEINQFGNHVFHLFVIRSNNREKLMAYLMSKGVNVAIHYPKALPFLTCYKHRGFQEDDFPVASCYQNEILSLPLFAELTIDEVKYVAQMINDFCLDMDNESPE